MPHEKHILPYGGASKKYGGAHKKLAFDIRSTPEQEVAPQEPKQLHSPFTPESVTTTPKRATSTRACCQLQSLLPPPELATFSLELAAASGACLLLHPEPSTASRSYRCLQTLPPPSNLAAASRPLLPPLELDTSSRTLLPLQSLQPPPELTTSSRTCCRLQSLPVLELAAASRAYYYLQSLPLDLAATSRLCYYLQTLLLPLDLTATSRICCDL